MTITITGRLASGVAVAAIAVVGATGAQAAPAPNAASSPFPTVAPGSDGQNVRALQYLLLQQGQRTDWKSAYTQSTKTAVANYQRANKLSATGIADPATLDSLTRKAGVTAGANRYATYAVETLLKRHGYTFDGTSPAMTTVYTPTVRGMVNAFQVGHGLNPTSDVGTATWRTLFAAKTSGPIYPLMQAGTGVAQWSNCGPASAVAILLYLGKTPSGWTGDPAKRAAAINRFRYVDSKVPNNATWNKAGTTYKNLVPGFASYGVRARATSPQQAVAAVKAGHPAIVGGDAGKLWWDQVPGANLRIGGHASHFIAVLGWDGSNFIVVDPLVSPSQNVVHRISESALLNFAKTAPGWGPGVLGNDVSPSMNSIVTG